MDERSSGKSGTPGMRALLAAAAIAACLFAAYAVAISPPAMAHNADSLIPIFVSLEQWSLFYWGQDRFGMLTPLLALPFHDSFNNLVVQNVISVALLIAGAVAAFARAGIRRPVIAALVFLAILAIAGRSFVFLLMTTNQSYAPALGFAGMALYFCRDRLDPIRLAIAAVLMMIAGWANGGVALMVLFITIPLVLLTPWLPRVNWMSVQLAFCAAASIVGHRVLQQFVPDRTTFLLPPAPGDIPGLLLKFWTQTGDLGAPIFWAIVVVSWIAALVLCAGPERKVWRLGLIGVAVFAIGYGCLMAVMFHGRSRYFAPAAPVLLGLPLTVIALMPSVARALTSYAAAAIALIALTAAGFRLPGAAREDLIAHLGRGQAERVHAQRVAAVTGDYWQGWELLFAANLLHEQQTGQRPILPVLERAERLEPRQLAALQPGAVVVIVPSGELTYWKTRPALPPLEVTSDGTAFALGRISGVPAPTSASSSPGR